MRNVKVTKSKHIETGKIYDYPINDEKYELIITDALFHQFMQEGSGGETCVVAVIEHHSGKVETLTLSAIVFS